MTSVGGTSSVGSSAGPDLSGLIGTEQMHVLSLLAADESNGGGGQFFTLAIFLLIPLAMYFLMIRPQRRRMRDQQAMQTSLEVGDEVLTASGIYGFITGFEDDRIWLEIDEDVQVRVNRGFIQGKVDTSSAASAGSGGRPGDAKAIEADSADAADDVTTDTAPRDTTE